MNAISEHVDVPSSAISFVQQRIAVTPQVGLILGSGLSHLADVLEDPVIIASSEIPEYPGSTVEGHKGQLVFGTLEGVPVVFVQGRLHVYEGHTVHAATFPVRLMAALGVKQMVVTNAAGGIHPECTPGTLMWITDHISFAFRPVPGPPSSAFERPNSEGTPYDIAWTTRGKLIADSLDIPTRQGTYLWTLGPSYETKAEIRMFRWLGADAVGMSTVPEVIVARHHGMQVIGISTITNFAAGLGQESLDHQEVLEVGRQVRDDLQKLITALVADLRS
jgi:purine-nucleoside phosphorylase